MPDLDIHPSAYSQSDSGARVLSTTMWDVLPRSRVWPAPDTEAHMAEGGSFFVATRIRHARRYLGRLVFISEGLGGYQIRLKPRTIDTEAADFIGEHDLDEVVETCRLLARNHFGPQASLSTSVNHDRQTGEPELRLEVHAGKPLSSDEDIDAFLERKAGFLAEYIDLVPPSSRYWVSLVSRP